MQPLPRPLSNLFMRLGVQELIPLAPFTTFRIGGPARYLATLHSLADFQELSLALFEYGFPYHLLAGGSNTLFSDEGFLGLVIRLGPEFGQITPAFDEKALLVGASVSFAKLTRLALSLGIKSAVGWVGTPGHLGGAIKMNAGCKDGEINDVLQWVIGLKNGRLMRLDKEQLQLSYRKSHLPPNFIITHAHLKWNNDNVYPVSELIKNAEASKLKRKTTQPKMHSAGSFFKNPAGFYAAQLIEKCKLKGLQCGGAQISSHHANFIVNLKNATAFDVLNLAHIAKRRVFEQCQVRLEPEIKFVGSFSKEQHSFLSLSNCSF